MANDYPERFELSEDYGEIDLLIDTDPIALGQRCRRAEAEVKHLRDTLNRLDGLHRKQLRELAALPCLGSANGCPEAKKLAQDDADGSGGHSG